MKEQKLSSSDKKRVKKELRDAEYQLKKHSEEFLKKSRRNLIMQSVMSILALIMLIAIVVKMNQFIIPILIEVVVIISALVLIIYDILTDKISNFFHRHKKSTLIIFTLIAFGFASFVCYDITNFFEIVPSKLSGFNKWLAELFNPTELFGFYTAQLSLTFISISVMSVLSDKSVVIYWSNVSKDRLIEPTFTCFAAYTYYSIASTICAGLGVALKNSLMFAFFFAVDVLVLILLTLSVTDVYYGRDTKKEKLLKKLRGIHKNFWERKRLYAKYDEMMLSFAQNITTAAQNSDLLYLQEAYELVVKNPYCFEKQKGRGNDDPQTGRYVIEALISTLDDATFSVFAQAMDLSLEVQETALARYITELEHGAKHLANKTLDSDALFWETLSDNEYFLNLLSKEPRTDRESIKQSRLFKWIASRMQLDFEKNAIAYNAANPDDQIPYEEPTWAQTEKVMEYAFIETKIQDNRFFVSFANMLCTAFDNEKVAKEFISIFDNPPYVYYVLDQIEFLDIHDNLREDMDRIFRKHHPDATLRKTHKWAVKTKSQDK